MSQSIRVLVVDDSALMRQMISDAIEHAPNMEVVGTAVNGADAIRKVAELKPDCVTLDVLMPEMSGLEALPKILEISPVPVVMASATTTRDADSTLDALDHGAMDYVVKSNSVVRTTETWVDELIIKIRQVTGADVAGIMRIRKTKRRRRERAVSSTSTDSLGQIPAGYANSVVAIGISTGGPPALARLFAEIHPPLPPIVIVQHMPADFTGPFSRRLDSLSEISVKEAATGDKVLPNHAYLAPGGKHLEIVRSRTETTLRVFDGDPISGHKPSVDCMFASAANVYRKRSIGVIMTGMGYDGADGCGHIRQAGGFVLGQDAASSDVYGMNKVAFTRGNVDAQFDLAELANLLEKACRERFSVSRPLVTS